MRGACLVVKGARSTVTLTLADCVCVCANYAQVGAHLCAWVWTCEHDVRLAVCATHPAGRWAEWLCRVGGRRDYQGKVVCRSCEAPRTGRELQLVGTDDNLPLPAGYVPPTAQPQLAPPLLMPQAKPRPVQLRFSGKGAPGGGQQRPRGSADNLHSHLSS